MKRREEESEMDRGESRRVERDKATWHTLVSKTTDVTMF